MRDSYLTIDIGGTFTKYAVMDEHIHILGRGKVPTEKNSAEDFLRMLERIYAESGPEISGIAVSSAGVIDSDRGFMYNGGSNTCIENLNLSDVLGSRTGVPVTVENDARAAAYAELWKGSLSGCRNAIVMVIGTAVGGAVIADGKVLQGSHQMAGEFSYVLTDAQDPSNPAKTLATSGGMPSLIRNCSKELGIPENELSGELIFERAEKGLEPYYGCLRKFVSILAVEVLNLHFIFDPEKVAIGGGVSAQPLFISLIRKELARISKVYGYEVPLPLVTPCRYFNDANLIGALYVHLQNKRSTVRKTA